MSQATNPLWKMSGMYEDWSSQLEAPTMQTLTSCHHHVAVVKLCLSPLILHNVGDDTGHKITRELGAHAGAFLFAGKNI